MLNLGQQGYRRYFKGLHLDQENNLRPLRLPPGKTGLLHWVEATSQKTQQKEILEIAKDGFDIPALQSLANKTAPKIS